MRLAPRNQETKRSTKLSNVLELSELLDEREERETIEEDELESFEPAAAQAASELGVPDALTLFMNRAGRLLHR